MVRARVRVRGRVQGVGFRWFVLHHARQLGVKGYVRNCPDGSVEVVVEGEPAVVERLLELVRLGPPPARVQAVEVQWETPTGEFADFDVRRTG
ncbi:Acylphosphatase [bacterium HR21]|nr:Acylphosphatase [bacterium HR21]